MTWTTDIHIGELRPWPESVDVVRGDETRRYVPEEELENERQESAWAYDFLRLMAGRIRSDADVHSLPDYVSTLEAENAKLRELVRGLRWCHDKPWNNGACDQCPISGRAVGRCDRLVRELGIEVDV